MGGVVGIWASTGHEIRSEWQVCHLSMRSPYIVEGRRREGLKLAVFCTFRGKKDRITSHADKLARVRVL
ncbi:hypothetical protein PISMIDRAFT_678085, partial [Pisolithus microcarpus 441]